MSLIKESFTPEELRSFLQRSDLLAWITVLSHWAIIVFAFWLAAYQTNVITVLVAFVLLGGRQLGCGSLMHECGHGSLFRSKKLNHFVGKWLGAAPVLYRIDDYMSSHLRHHRDIGNGKDPDLHRYRNYPVSKDSLRRKMWRDFSGQTSWKNLKALLYDNGVLLANEAGKTRFNVGNLFRRLYAPLIMNLGMLLVLALSGHAALYLIWVAAYFSSYMVCSRIRNLAEHAAVPNLQSENPFDNTRTTIPRWWERLTVAPNSVNYHLEHHLLPGVPKYRLASFHKALKQKGLLDNADICAGYGEVLRKLVAVPV